VIHYGVLDSFHLVFEGGFLLPSQFQKATGVHKTAARWNEIKKYKESQLLDSHIHPDWKKYFYYCIHYTTTTPIQYIAGCIQQIGKKRSLWYGFWSFHNSYNRFFFFFLYVRVDPCVGLFIREPLQQHGNSRDIHSLTHLLQLAASSYSSSHSNARVS
jgi:quinol-cytochrome oxidoreductase complex cytochrome b subunit